MLTARMVNKQIVYAPEMEKGSGPFYCPSCGENVILKKGEKYIHHFAHLPQAACDLRGESVQHMTAKWEIYQGLKSHPQVGRVEVEHTLWPKTRADVMFRKGHEVIAVEVQRSRLDTDTILRRMMHYTANNISVLWLTFPLKTKHEWINADNCIHYATPQKWQRFIQSMYYGRLYEWSNGWGLEVYQTHLTGAWHRRHSGLKTGAIVNIVNDFKSQKRAEYKDTPSVRIYIDTYPKWWS